MANNGKNTNRMLPLGLAWCLWTTLGMEQESILRLAQVLRTPEQQAFGVRI